jgi:hypothetical protein
MSFPPGYERRHCSFVDRFRISEHWMLCDDRVRESADDRLATQASSAPSKEDTS